MGIGAAVSAFERLIQEEEKHIAFIKRLMDKLKQEETIQLADLKGVILEPINYFDERAKSEFLEQCVEGSMVPDVSVFNTAWLMTTGEAELPLILFFIAGLFLELGALALALGLASVLSGYRYKALSILGILGGAGILITTLFLATLA